MVGYDFPLLSVFWVMLIWFFMFSIFFAVIWAFIDNFRRHDHGGWAKAGWAFLILIFPFFGMLIYLIVRRRTRRDGLRTTPARLPKPCGPAAPFTFLR